MSRALLIHVQEVGRSGREGQMFGLVLARGLGLGMGLGSSAQKNMRNDQLQVSLSAQGA